MEALSTPINGPETSLQLLLFVDKRPSSREKIRQIRNYLKALEVDHTFQLQVIDVGEQPHMAEHFKLVATPALIKIHPNPRHTLAGTDLVAQLENWWSRWQRSLEEYVSTLEIQPDAVQNGASESAIDSILYSAEMIQLSDEVFRLEKEKEELQEKLQFKDRLIAMLAHDLRNPLTAASIALETLEMGLDPKEGISDGRMTPALIAQLLRHARTQTKVIDRMITDVLQAAQSTGAEFQVHPQRIDLVALCHDLLTRLKRQFQGKSQEMVIDIPQDLPTVYADPDRVLQVMVNLLDNAIKYTPESGTIRVSALHRTSQKVQISICDDGPGIPEADRERIFEDRFRLERDSSKDGYGMGLSLCQRVIRAHYGQIWVDSTPNQGSCFHFTLPVCRS